MQTLNTIAIVIAIAGSVIIVWKILVTAFMFIRAECSKLMGKNNKLQDAKIRYSISSYLLIGPGFMLTADIIHTIHNPILMNYIFWPL